MRILMLGNSFTFTNNMPQMLADLTGAEVDSPHPGRGAAVGTAEPQHQAGRPDPGGAPKGEVGLCGAPGDEPRPITAPKSFFSSVEQLCRQIRANGAVPILFATWTYQKGGAKLTDKGWDYDEMAQKLSEPTTKRHWKITP